MSYDSLNDALVLGRAVYAASEQADKFSQQSDGSWKFESPKGTYTIADGECDCPAARNIQAAQSLEAMGMNVGPYPKDCKHAKAVQLLEGKLNLNEVEFTDDEREKFVGGYNHQERLAKNVVQPVGTISIVARTPRVQVLKVRAEKGMALDLGNGKRLSEWTFALNGHTVAEATERLHKMLGGKGYTVSVEKATPEWAATLTPIS